MSQEFLLVISKSFLKLIFARLKRLTLDSGSSTAHTDRPHFQQVFRQTKLKCWQQTQVLCFVGLL